MYIKFLHRGKSVNETDDPSDPQGGMASGGCKFFDGLFDFPTPLHVLLLNITDGTQDFEERRKIFDREI